MAIFMSNYRIIAETLFYFLVSGFITVNQAQVISWTPTFLPPSSFLQLESRPSSDNHRTDPLFSRQLYTSLLPAYGKNSTSNQVEMGLIPGLDFSDGYVPGVSTWASVYPFPGLTIANEMVLRRPTDTDTEYIGDTWRSVAGYTRQAYIHAQTFKSDNPLLLAITTGRFYNIQGPGRGGQLIMGYRMRPLDMTRVYGQLGSFELLGLTAQLNPVEGNIRYLSLHRLEYAWKNGWLGVSEAFLYGGPNRSVLWPLLNPVIFFHGVQLNGPNVPGNTLGSLDAYLRIGANWAVYGELLVDDVQLDKQVPGDLEPNEIGVLLGFETHQAKYYFGVEYVGITNRTYKSTTQYEWYIHRNEPIGYFQGSDLQHFNAQFRYYLSPRCLVDCAWDNHRQGEGEMSIAWDSPWINYSVEEGYSENFPTGIIETTNRIQLASTWYKNAFHYFRFGLELKTIQNLDHVQDNRLRSLIGYVEMTWALGFSGNRW